MELNQALADLECLSGLTDGARSALDGSVSFNEDALDNIDPSALRPRELAQHFAPALARLQASRVELQRLVRAGLAGRSSVAWSVLQAAATDSGECAPQPLVELSPKLSQRLQSYCNINSSTGNSNRTQEVERLAAPGFDYASIRASLDMCNSSEEYVRTVREALGTQGITVPMWWVLDFNPRKSGGITKRDDTHQDMRDVERDTVVINGTSLIGVELKYKGVIEAFMKVLRDSEAWVARGGSSSNNSSEINQERHDAALRRFARSVLNAGNRTNSGGNAFESIMLLFGGSPHALVTPDSEKAEPIQINISLEPFVHGTEKKHADNDKESVTAIQHEEWGLVATVSGTTKFHLNSHDNVENSLGGVVGEFRQVLAMAWPPPRFDSPLTQDDHNNVANKTDYRVLESAEVFMDGQVAVRNWAEWNLKTMFD